MSRRSCSGGTAAPGRRTAPLRRQVQANTAPLAAAVGAVVITVVALLASRVVLEAIVTFEWPIPVYVAITGVVVRPDGGVERARQPPLGDRQPAAGSRRGTAPIDLAGNLAGLRRLRRSSSAIVILLTRIPLTSH